MDTLPGTQGGSLPRVLFNLSSFSTNYLLFKELLLEELLSFVDPHAAALRGRRIGAGGWGLGAGAKGWGGGEKKQAGQVAGQVAGH